MVFLKRSRRCTFKARFLKTDNILRKLLCPLYKVYYQGSVWENSDHSDEKPKNAAQSNLIDDVKNMFPEKSQAKFVATMFNFKKCIQVDETLYICHSRCHLSNANKWQLLHHILTIQCAKSQLMYVEMANNCFQKIYKAGSLYSINTEQVVCMVLTLYAFSIHTATWLRKLQRNNRLAEPPE